MTFNYNESKIEAVDNKFIYVTIKKNQIINDFTYFILHTKF